MRPILLVSLFVACCSLSSLALAEPNNGGGSFKTKSDLERDGWTCTQLEGTTVINCTKPGEGKSWSCNDRGMCTQNFTTGGSRPKFTVPLGKMQVFSQ